MNFKSKLIVITGAAGGFGAAMTRLFLKKGAAILALDRDLAALKKLRRSCIDDGFEIETAVCDVTKPQDFERIADKLAKSARFPDVWINNAGISRPKAFSATSPADFARVMDVNFNGVVYGTRTALRLMETKQAGVIVNIASASGFLPSPFLISYSASKHAVVGFTRGLALELYQQASPIKLCLVSPGFADTAIMKSNPDFCLPKSFSWGVDSPQSVATAIVNAVASGKEEICPGLSAAGLMAFYRYAPKVVFKMASRAFTARNWKELIGLEGIRNAG